MPSIGHPWCEERKGNGFTKGMPRSQERGGKGQASSMERRGRRRVGRGEESLTYR